MTGDWPGSLVIPAAGLGTRMREVDPELPKELLPVGGRPAIEYTVEEGLDAGIERIVVIIRRGKEVLREHLEARYPQVAFHYQARPLGEMDAIALAEDAGPRAPVAVVYPDNLYLPAPGALRRLAEAHVAHGLDVVALTPMDQEAAEATSNAGRVDLEPLQGDLFRVCRFLPKSRGTFVPRFPGELRTCGMMVLGPDLYDRIRRVRPTIPEGAELTDGPVRELSLDERGYLGLLLPGRVFDIGNPTGYALCQEVVALRGQPGPDCT